MANCTCNQNQTPEAALAALTNNNNFAPGGEQLLGTGLFGIPDPSKSDLDSTVILVPDIDYFECLRRGARCESFQWIPNTMMSYKKIKEEREAGTCFQGCSGPNHKPCKPGCLCDHYGFCH